MSAYEPFVGARFLYARLIQSPALAALTGQRVYRDVAPSGAESPYVVFSLVAASDLMVVGALRVWTRALWQVEYWQRTSNDGLVATGAAAIDAALHGTSGTLTGAPAGSGVVWSLVRERPLPLPPEIDGDVIWRRAGGEYRMEVSAA